MENTKSSRQVASVTTAELYNRWAKVYDTDGNILQATDDLEIPFLLDQFFSLLSNLDSPPNGLKVTELGCGTGRNTAKLLARALSKNVSEIQGLDLSSSMLEIARQRCGEIIVSMGAESAVPKPEFHVFDAMSGSEPPIEACRAHGVISTLVLEHFPLDMFFGSVKKLLRSGGEGYLLLTNMHEEMGRQSQAGFVDEETDEKVRGESFVYSVEQVVEEAKRWGFVPVIDLKEREVQKNDLEGLGKRGKKWVGCHVWFGGVFKLTDTGK